MQHNKIFVNDFNITRNLTGKVAYISPGLLDILLDKEKYWLEHLYYFSLRTFGVSFNKELVCHHYQLGLENLLNPCGILNTRKNVRKTSDT